jgi:metal-responsive CopG/Arc/MetJ family transcriptional regulator
MTRGVTLTVRKITVSIDEKLLAELEQQAGKARVSRSEWLAQAARRTLDQAAVIKAMDEILSASGGPSTREEVAEARKALGLAPRRPRRTPGTGNAAK